MAAVSVINRPAISVNAKITQLMGDLFLLGRYISRNKGQYVCQLRRSTCDLMTNGEVCLGAFSGAEIYLVNFLMVLPSKL